MLRASPSHLSPATHNIDGDGYVLAVTICTDSPSFARGRYIRTKAYMREQRLGERLYVSRGGTPASNRRFRRVKRACADGVIAWGGRLFARGERGLPMWLDPATLVSRGYSALGAALTDRDEMARERGASLVAAPVRIGDVIALCARGVNEERLFFSESKGDFTIAKRLPPLPFPRNGFVVDFRVTESFFVVLVAFEKLEQRNFLLRAIQGDAPVLPVLGGRGVAVGIARRDAGNRADFSLVELPGAAFCTQITRVVDEHGGLRVDAVEIMGGVGEISRAELADAGVAASDEKGRSAVLSSFRIDVDKGTAERVGDGCCDGVSVRSISACGRYATVVDDTKRRAGIAAIDGTSVSRVAWASAEGATVSGVVTSPDGQVVSAMVTSDGVTKLQFWKANELEEVHAELELPASQFGEITHSCGAVWDETVAKYTEGGKVVKSAYEIFDDRNWNDINSGFSSLGINQ